MQVEAAPREAMENRTRTARTGLRSLLLQDGAPANTCAKARSEVKRPSSRPCPRITLFAICSTFYTVSLGSSFSHVDSMFIEVLGTALRSATPYPFSSLVFLLVPIECLHPVITNPTVKSLPNQAVPTGLCSHLWQHRFRSWNMNL